jgi:hypothetical protein
MRASKLLFGLAEHFREQPYVILLFTTLPGVLSPQAKHARIDYIMRIIFGKLYKNYFVILDLDSFMSLCQNDYLSNKYT